MASSEYMNSRIMNLETLGERGAPVSVKSTEDLRRHGLIITALLRKLILYTLKNNHRKEAELVVRCDQSGRARVNWILRCRESCYTHFDDRGTTIDARRSYFVFQSLTRFLRMTV